MNRIPLLVANWKMNLNAGEAAKFARAFRELIAPARADLGQRFEIAIAPAYPALDRLGQALEGSGIGLAAQNVHAEPSGAFTGEISISMLEDLGCRYALIGHSERRRIFGETDLAIQAKAKRLEESPVAPILCVGETLGEREAGSTLEIVARQLDTALDGASHGLASRLVVAYEPIWAIGTGRTATPEIAQTVHAAIRKTLIARLGSIASDTRILYGGSVMPSNARELLSQSDVNGALVGGASLDPESFAKIALASLETP
ncbi:MAG: triose-phosphate isomerase [Myxococcales bacterium]|nr:triose-phosphate isomerase [Myxococcales bacterium]HIL79701.1 triose-phosphate isomerase [Myxococcales bacterium]